MPSFRKKVSCLSHPQVPSAWHRREGEKGHNIKIFLTLGNSQIFYTSLNSASKPIQKKRADGKERRNRWAKNKRTSSFRSHFRMLKAFVYFISFESQNKRHSTDEKIEVQRGQVLHVKVTRQVADLGREAWSSVSYPALSV